MEVETHSLSPTFELIHLLSQSTTDTYFPPNNAANQPSLGHATAVLKLQKVYRTRLAGWPTPPLLPRRWQAIDYVRVNHSTISFFNLPETAASCWSRVKLNAAKVGKGLSKDAIAQKCWLSSIGSKLLIHDIAMDITYNTTIKNGVKQMLQEREQYEYIVREDKIINKQYGDLFHTNEDSEDAKWIFVMSTSKKLYAGKKKKGLFHHSSFLAGGATLAAGRLVAENEILKSISAYSGHYRPTDDTLDSFLSYLKENGVKLDEVELHKANEDSDIYEESNQGQAIAGQYPDEKISTTTVETEMFQQDDCSRHMKVEQDADVLPNTSYSLVRSRKSRRNLTEEEKEVRRIRRILANRESARQTIRRRQALCEELTRKAASLVVENENLKREKQLALNEYQSLETTNKHLKAQIAKSINTEVEKTPVEPGSSVAEVTPLSGNGPWFLYNHFPVPQIFWPSILQFSNPVHLQNTSLNSFSIPPNAYVPCSSESESRHKQNNLINDNRTQNPFYMFPCPWLFPLPQFGNQQSSPSSSLKDEQDNLSLGKPCSSSSSLNTMANVDYQAALPIKLKTAASGWTEAISINGPGWATPRSSLDGEHEFQLHSAPNNKVSSTAYIATSSLEKKQGQCICQGRNLVDAVAAAEARKRRKELTKQKSIHNRQSRMHC
ncbi:hypothetical protein JHK85_008181 [Glycine max]|nr:hypothetical protein JHK85_008181 [Glycine max]KAG5072734.1 hypothetical protein JHK86_007945 [Glycine max]